MTGGAAAAQEGANGFLVGNVIDGKAVAAQLRKEISATVTSLQERHGKVPGLAVVIVGERKDSQTYVRMKRRACAEVGIRSFECDMPEASTQQEVLGAVARFNADPNVHGILVQLPLPKHIDEEAVLAAISVDKDVDGFHPSNIGKLCMKGRDPLFVPCTPAGCIELLDRIGTDLRGKRAVVVGRSNIVGMPVAMLLLKRNATVTICHSASKDMAAIVREADVVVAAAGQPQLIKGDWIKPGAIIIDVGTNPVDDATKKLGYRLVGDCDFDGCRAAAGALTAVPGGVGPMTIAMLLKNTLTSAERFLEGTVGRDKTGAASPQPHWSTVVLGTLAGAAVVQGLVRRVLGVVGGSGSKSSRR
ncbi:MAG: bifunctional protein [Monoraphidium minutum]|nr:MAG: bifunctional protein [Monoraphidium minutum]